jgi:hypothetical protein
MTNRRVVTGENEGAGFVDYAEDRHVVATPVAPIEEPTGRIEIDAAWVIAPVHSSPGNVKSPVTPRAKRPQLSCKRLPPWTNRPSPETSISEVRLLPPNPGVGVEVV